MIFRKYIAIYNGKKFIIEEDIPDVGAYLYVYEKDKCIYDYLQDNIVNCQKLAFENFEVPLDSWTEF